MPNLEDLILNAETPIVHMKVTQRKRTKRVLPSWINMISSDQGSTTKRTPSSSDQAMVLGMKSKQIVKRGKRISKKVSIA